MKGMKAMSFRSTNIRSTSRSKSCGSSDARFTQQFVNANNIGLAIAAPIDKDINFFIQPGDHCRDGQSLYRKWLYEQSAAPPPSRTTALPLSPKLESDEAYESPFLLDRVSTSNSSLGCLPRSSSIVEERVLVAEFNLT